MSIPGIALHPHHPSHVSAESHLGSPFFPREGSHTDQVADFGSPKHSKQRSSKKTDISDAASVSSFGSSITLLKSKFRSSSTSSSASQKKQDKEKRNILRNQVNFVG